MWTIMVQTINHLGSSLLERYQFLITWVPAILCCVAVTVRFRNQCAAAALVSLYTATLMALDILLNAQTGNLVPGTPDQIDYLRHLAVARQLIDESDSLTNSWHALQTEVTTRPLFYFILYACDWLTGNAPSSLRSLNAIARILSYVSLMSAGLAMTPARNKRIFIGITSLLLWSPWLLYYDLAFTRDSLIVSAGISTLAFSLKYATDTTPGSVVLMISSLIISYLLREQTLVFLIPIVLVIVARKRPVAVVLLSLLGTGIFTAALAGAFGPDWQSSLAWKTGILKRALPGTLQDFWRQLSRYVLYFFNLGFLDTWSPSRESITSLFSMARASMADLVLIPCLACISFFLRPLTLRGACFLSAVIGGFLYMATYDSFVAHFAPSFRQCMPLYAFNIFIVAIGPFDLVVSNPRLRQCASPNKPQSSARPDQWQTSK